MEVDSITNSRLYSALASAKNALVAAETNVDPTDVQSLLNYQDKNNYFYQLINFLTNRSKSYKEMALAVINNIG